MSPKKKARTDENKAAKRSAKKRKLALVVGLAVARKRRAKARRAA